jgi:ABC-2 type transport system ATP-binding protein
MTKQILNINTMNYVSNNIQILKNVCLNINEGKVMGLIGKNGSGKSTLISCIIGLINNYSGLITINGIDAKNALSRKYISFIPPEFYKLNNTTILEFLMANAYMYGMNKNQAIIKIKSLCKDIGYPYKRINLKFNILSSGLKKMILIMQALLNPNLKLLLADEPLVNLDYETKQCFLNVIKKLATKYKVAILMSTHNINEMNGYVDCAMRCVLGKITEVQLVN